MEVCLAWFNPRILRYVDEISRCGSIRGAGEKLNVAPSSINRQLIALEERLGVQLFERGPRRMVLTAAGELIVAYARQTGSAERRMLDELDTLKGARASHCTISTVAGVAGDLLAHVLASHRKENPGTTFTVQVTNAEAVAAAVAANETDIGFAFDMPRLPRTSIAASIRTECGAVVGPGHPLATHRRVHLHEIATYPLVLPIPGVSVRNALDNAAWQAGLRLQPALESDNFDLLRRCMVHDHAVAVLNRMDVLHAAEAGECVFLPLIEIRGFSQDLSVMHFAQSRPTHAARLLLDRLGALLTGIANV